MKRFFFETCLVIIVLVAGYDTYLNIKYPVDSNTELNPVARQVLLATNEDLAFLIASKLVSTALVAIFLQHYYKVNSFYAIVTCGCLAAVQIFVFFYLLWS